MSKKYKVKSYPDGSMYLTLDFTEEEYQEFKKLSGDEQEKYISEYGSLEAEDVRAQISYTTIRDLDSNKNLETEEWFSGW